MDGLFVVESENNLPQSNIDAATTLHLLLRLKDMEVMRQRIPLKDQFIWLSPAEDTTTCEFFYILGGAIDLRVSENETKRLTAGDSFYVNGITESVFLSVVEDLDVIYICNRPVFDQVSDFNDRLYAKLEEINEYDTRTLLHSKNVMAYCAEIYNKLGDTALALDDFLSAAVFHDIGKCEIPIEILKKPGKLTQEEFAVMKEHPAISERILTSCFGEDIARIAGQHHERLDGSGYPKGLKGDEISVYSRIIAIADSFDAMTVERPYNTIKTPEQAIAELYSLPHLYDADIVAVLDALIKDGRITHRKQ